MAANEGLVARPTSMEEVEHLVQRLYKESAPKVVAAIDEQLKQVQNSAEGWQIADTLLGRQDPQVRFFAALTFQVKLNNDGASLDAATADSVLMRMLSWTVQLDQANEGQLVRKKLSSAMATFFVRVPGRWNRPLLHLSTSYRQGQVFPQEELPDANDALIQILPLLNESQRITLLWLSGALAHYASKIDNTNAEQARMHNQMEIQMQDAAQLMQHALSGAAAPSVGTSVVRAESLACFLNWIEYAQPMWTHSKQAAIDHLRNLVPSMALLLTDPEIRTEAMDILRDILENYTSFFRSAHMELLATIIHQHIRPILIQGLQDQDFEATSAAQLVIAYGIANIQQVVEEPQNEYGSKTIVQLVLAILEAPGYPGDDDELSVQSIEFWNTYVEYVNDTMYSHGSETQAPAWLDHDKAVCMRLATLLWSKMRTPSPDLLLDWNEFKMEAFSEFRMDASDLILSIYVRLGKELLQQLIASVLSALAMKRWQDLEAALFCVNAVADNVMEDAGAEQELVQLFGSPLFREVADFNQPIPNQVRRTAIDTLGAYGLYMERHAEFLPDTIRFLFASLETSGFHLSAAKSIESLCSACRSSLTGELGEFITQYHRFTQSPTSEPYTNERVIGAIAAIVQAMSPESAKAGPLSALLDIVDGFIAMSRKLGEQGDADMAHNMGVSAVDCLVRIGKSMQVPDDVPIDLYEQDSTSKKQENYWQGREGQAIQLRILQTCYGVLQMLPGSGEVVDSLCQVFRSGFTETEPGPFVFSPDMSVGLLEQCSITTPHLESILSMIVSEITQYSRTDYRRIDAEITRIYHKTASFILALGGQPSQDPSLAQSCIDVFARMTVRYSNVLLDTSSTGAAVPPILDFAIQALDGPDLMPKRAAANFWFCILSPPTSSSDPAVRSRVDQVIAAYASPLCRALMGQISGRAQRSELDSLCEPLRALVSNRAQDAKGWLETALFDPGAPLETAHARVSEAEKRRFVQQVVGLRGDARRTREVVRNFFAACRGTVASYASS